MSDKGRTRNQEPTSSPPSDDDVRRLLQTAGPRTEIPSDDLETIKEAARTEYRQRWSRRNPRRGLVVGLGLAASILVVFSISRLPRQTDVGIEPASGPVRVAVVELFNGPLTVLASLGGPGARVLSSDDFVHAGDTLETGNGTAALRLPSGLSLRLDRGTRVRFASESSVEILEGALYADSGLGIAGDSAGDRAGDSLLKVSTPFGEVRDIGTQFEVRRSSSPEGLRIRVREGSIALEKGSAVYTAGAGEELSLGSDGEVDRGVVSIYGPQWEWVLSSAPPLDMEGRTLREYLDWLAKETGWQILLAADTPAGVEETLLHGSTAPRLESVADVLLACGLKPTLSDGTLHVAPAPAKDSAAIGIQPE